MCLNHGGENLLHEQRLFTGSDSGPGEPVGDGKDASQIVGWMAPFCGQPRVVEVQPPDHRTDIEGGLHRVKLKLGSRHPCAIGHDCARNDWPQQFGASRIFECLKPATEGIDEAIARGLVSKIALYFVVHDVVHNIDEHFVGTWTLITDGCRHGISNWDISIHKSHELTSVC